MTKRPYLRTRLIGTWSPHASFGTLNHDHEIPTPEVWIIYVFEHPRVNLRPEFYVVGRLSKRPFTRMGGEPYYSLATARQRALRMARNCFLGDVQRTDWTGKRVRSCGTSTSPFSAPDDAGG
jgi:hypothetical protein